MVVSEVKASMMGTSVELPITIDPRQVAYAAMDAHVSVDIFLALHRLHCAASGQDALGHDAWARPLADRESKYAARERPGTSRSESSRSRSGSSRRAAAAATRVTLSVGDATEMLLAGEGTDQDVTTRDGPRVEAAALGLSAGADLRGTHLCEATGRGAGGGASGGAGDDWAKGALDSATLAASLAALGLTDAATLVSAATPAVCGDVGTISSVTTGDVTSADVTKGGALEIKSLAVFLQVATVRPVTDTDTRLSCRWQQSIT